MNWGWNQDWRRELTDSSIPCGSSDLYIAIRGVFMSQKVPTVRSRYRGMAPRIAAGTSRRGSSSSATDVPLSDCGKEERAAQERPPESRQAPVRTANATAPTARLSFQLPLRSTRSSQRYCSNCHVIRLHVIEPPPVGRPTSSNGRGTILLVVSLR